MDLVGYYNYEISRRYSFRNWSIKQPDIDFIAKLGFYHNSNNFIKCNYCNKIQEVKEDSNIYLDHLKFSLKCTFIINYINYEYNMIEDVESEKNIKYLMEKLQIKNFNSINSENYNDFLNKIISKQYNITIDQCSDINIPNNLIDTENFKEFTEFLTFEKRCMSFPIQMINKESIEEMASAGFHYYKIKDKENIKCFNCNIILDNFKNIKNYWEEHLKLSKDCNYLRLSEKKTNTILDKSDIDLRIKCIVCITNPSSIAFIPCGHLSLCEFCSSNVDSCVICRQKGKKYVIHYN